MESKDELKKIDIKNLTCYYFDDIMRTWDIDIDTDFSNVLLYEKLYKEKNENILIFDISYRSLTGAKLLLIGHDKIDGFIKIHNKIRYLVLIDDWCNKICDEFKYFVSKKSGITDSINHNFGIMRIYSYDPLLIEKKLIFHSVIILIKSFVNKYKNNYYYHMFLEKGSYKDISNTEYY